MIDRIGMGADKTAKVVCVGGVAIVHRASGKRWRGQAKCAAPRSCHGTRVSMSRGSVRTCGSVKGARRLSLPSRRSVPRLLGRSTQPCAEYPRAKSALRPRSSTRAMQKCGSTSGRIAAEGALWAASGRTAFCPVIVSDDAGRFNVGRHGPCCITVRHVWRNANRDVRYPPAVLWTPPRAAQSYPSGVPSLPSPRSRPGRRRQ